MNKNLGLLWIVVIGGFGFAVGFFGPMIFAPDANQGPMLGIFITGPLGAIAGGFLWILSANLNWTLDFQKKAAKGACALIVAGIAIAMLMPKDEWPGRIYEIEVQSCLVNSGSEIILHASVLSEKLVKLKKPLFRANSYFAFPITSKNPQVSPFYIAGTCSEFPIGFKGTYYVSNEGPRRDKAVLLPVPEHLKNL